MNITAKVRNEVSLALSCVRAFQNWPTVLAWIVLDHLGVRRGTFCARTKRGVKLSAPPHRTSWWPIVDVYALDSYAMLPSAWTPSPPPATVLIVGAHIGAVACLLAERFPAARLTCVEPSPSSVRFLRQNLAQNGFSDRAQVVPAALARRDGEVELWAPEQAFFAASTSPRAGPSRRVRAMSFASLIVATGGPPQLVSLSCAGGELAAISAENLSQWSAVHHLFLEVGPSAQPHFQKMQELLASAGLRLVRLRRDTRFLGVSKAYFAR